MQKISGNCLCGSVQYSSDAEPLQTSICHCDSCQRQTGTAFSIIVVVPKDSVVIQNSDTLGEHVSKGDSGCTVTRKFCTNCGSPILSLIEIAPSVCAIKAGTLNDKSWLKPTSQIWCSDAQPWLEFAEELEKHDGNPV